MLSKHLVAGVLTTIGVNSTSLLTEKAYSRSYGPPSHNIIAPPKEVSNFVYEAPVFEPEHDYLHPTDMPTETSSYNFFNMYEIDDIANMYGQ